jgi:hypothetical protein
MCLSLAGKGSKGRRQTCRQSVAVQRTASLYSPLLFLDLAAGRDPILEAAEIVDR